MEIDREEFAYVRLFNTIKAAKDVAEALTVLRDDFCEVAHITYHHAQTLSGQIAVDASNGSAWCERSDRKAERSDPSPRKLNAGRASFGLTVRCPKGSYQTGCARQGRRVPRTPMTMPQLKRRSLRPKEG